VEATQIALQVIQYQAYATGPAEAQRAYIDAVLAADEARRQQQIREAEAIRLARQQSWNNIWPILVWIAVAVFIGVVGLTVAMMWRRLTIEPIQIVTANGHDYPLIQSGQQWQMLPQPRVTIPATTQTIIEDEEEGVFEDIPPADWREFISWRDSIQVPIGADVRTRRPILISRAQKPHLLIAGTTGSGKTTTGLIPFVVANLGAGLQVVLMNGRGADFLPLEAHPNVTSLQADRAERPFLLISLLEAMVSEMDRRDRVLRSYAASNWGELPMSAGESGEVLVVVDEFLAIISEADNLAKDDESRMWSALIKITNEARKFGMYVALTMTDPTARALGKSGMTVRSQMARMVLTMNEEAASRAVLGNARDFPYGTVGLPVGQFIATVGGRAQHGVGFYPSPADVQAYFDSRPVRPSHLPDLLLDVEELPLLAHTAEPTNGAGVRQDEVDGLVLGNVIHEPYIKSLRTVGYYLLDRTPDQSVSGQEMDARIKPALEWRVRNMNCQKSRKILGQQLLH
jgi:hypothetical protein